MGSICRFIIRISVPGYWVICAVLAVAAIFNNNWLAAWFSFTTAFYATLESAKE